MSGLCSAGAGVAGVAVSCVPPCSREPRGRSPSVRADVPDARKAAVWRVFSAVRDVPPYRHGPRELNRQDAKTTLASRQGPPSRRAAAPA